MGYAFTAKAARWLVSIPGTASEGVLDALGIDIPTGPHGDIPRAINFVGGRHANDPKLDKSTLPNES